jgi:hypothetical protein
VPKALEGGHEASAFGTANSHGRQLRRRQGKQQASDEINAGANFLHTRVGQQSS